MDDISIYEFDTEEHKEPFRIKDDAGATWAMRKLADINSKIEENTAIANQEHDRINQWLEQVNNRFDQSKNYFESILEQYAREQRENANRKTIQLPHGVIKSRISNEKIRVEDTELFIKWAETNELNDLVRIKKEPNAINIKNELSITNEGKVVVTVTGEVAEHVTIVPESISFSVETGEIK